MRRTSMPDPERRLLGLDGGLRSLGAILDSLSPAALVGMGSPANGERPTLSLVEEIRAVTEEEEARAIRDALYAVRGNKAAAARRLGIPRTTLHDSMRRLKLG
jgi:transcriptional regulator of acetoin/glycerol metabolism